MDGLSLIARPWLSLALAVALSLSGVEIGAAEKEAGIEIISARTVLVDGVYKLDAEVSYEFSEQAMEALQNGVPLTIEVVIEVIKPRWWWLDGTVASLKQRHVLKFHALSRQYLVSNLNTGVQKRFYSRYAATLGMGQIVELPVIDAKLLDINERYEMRIRSILDIESLPSPLRPWAYFSSGWRLKSDWYLWPLES